MGRIHVLDIQSEVRKRRPYWIVSADEQEHPEISVLSIYPHEANGIVASDGTHFAKQYDVYIHTKYVEVYRGGSPWVTVRDFSNPYELAFRIVVAVLRGEAEQLRKS